MTVIEIKTEIESEIHRCFDLARDIDFHKLSAQATEEKAVAGRTEGLCELGDTITWEARHFGIRQRLTVKITGFSRPYYFEDRMTKGAFQSMRHEHHFQEMDGKTLMTDRFEYEVPFGILGRLFDWIILKQHMTEFLKTRNQLIKKTAEKTGQQRGIQE